MSAAMNAYSQLLNQFNTFSANYAKMFTPRALQG